MTNAAIRINNEIEGLPEEYLEKIVSYIKTLKDEFLKVGARKKKKDWRTAEIDSQVMALVRKDGKKMSANTDDKKILEIELRKKYGLQ